MHGNDQTKELAHYCAELIAAVVDIAVITPSFEVNRVIFPLLSSQAVLNAFIRNERFTIEDLICVLSTETMNVRRTHTKASEADS